MVEAAGTDGPVAKLDLAAVGVTGVVGAQVFVEEGICQDRKLNLNLPVYGKMTGKGRSGFLGRSWIHG